MMMMMMLNLFLSFSFSSRSLKKKTKRGVRGVSELPPLLFLQTSRPRSTKHVCLNVLSTKERERERERRRDLWFDSEEDERTNERTRERKKSSKKNFISPEFSSFLPRVSFKIPNALTHSSPSLVKHTFVFSIPRLVAQKRFEYDEYERERERRCSAFGLLPSFLPRRRRREAEILFNTEDSR